MRSSPPRSKFRNGQLVWWWLRDKRRPCLGNITSLTYSKSGTGEWWYRVQNWITGERINLPEYRLHEKIKRTDENPYHKEEEPYRRGGPFRPSALQSRYTIDTNYDIIATNLNIFGSSLYIV